MRHGGPRVAAIFLSVQTETQDGTLQTVHLDGASRRCIQTVHPDGGTQGKNESPQVRLLPTYRRPRPILPRWPARPAPRLRGRTLRGPPCPRRPCESLLRALAGASFCGSPQGSWARQPARPSSEHANSLPLREGPPLRGLKVTLTEGLCPASTPNRRPSVKVCRSGDSKPLTGMPFPTNSTSQVRGGGGRPRPIAAKRAVEVWAC